MSQPETLKTDPVPFAALGLAPPLTRAAGVCGWVLPTPVQAAAIPLILRGRDLIGCAQTGSGKTAAYALPLLQRLLAGRSDAPRKLRALVLVPTRELAQQVGQTFAELARGLPQRLKIVLAFGGISINPQMLDLRGGTDILVATPGRLLDLLARNACRLDEVQMLVLDEADRLLDLGFANEIGRVLDRLPPMRQSLLFSATFPPEVQALAERLLMQPARVDEAADAVAPAILQRAIEVDEHRRGELLARLIHDNGWSRLLVFVAARETAEQLALQLVEAGLRAAPFHGELSQRKRTDALAALKSQALQVVIATDVAARGLDIPQLPVVVNFDLPRSADDYTHRIGRTGRAGASGLAISFVSASTRAHFELIEKRCRVRVALERIAGFEPAPRMASNSASAPRAPGGIKGKRKSKKDKLREAAMRDA